MNIPTRGECLMLLKGRNVPENIIKHCALVGRIAVFLAKKLKEKGININVELVNAAALLHDIKRAEGVDKHAEKAYALLRERYPEVAEVIRTHQFDDTGKAGTWEQKVLYYADKRAGLGKIITLGERFQEWEQRHKIKFTEEQKKPVYALEKEIFDIIGIEPDKLGEYVE